MKGLFPLGRCPFCDFYITLRKEAKPDLMVTKNVFHMSIVLE